MWMEKYRPQRVDEILGQEEVVRYIKECIKNKTIPNLLLWGPKGTGKTSLVYALARELYGEFYAENLLSIEAMDFVDKGKAWLREDRRFRFFYKEDKSAIDIFKQIIREYAALQPINANFRILFFNNADLLPKAVQQSLRRTMESSSKTSRFIFSSTKPAGIITPIRSRCLNLHFRSLDKSGVLKTLLRNIAEREGIEITEEGLEEIEGFAGGDAGLAITMLEVAASIAIAKKSVIKVDREDIKKVKRFFPQERVMRVVDFALSHRYREAKRWMQLLLEEGMDGREILIGIHEALKGHMKKDINECVNKFAILFLHESDTDLKLCNSLNSMIHLEEMLSKFMRV
ncbi:MAG: AAA family ATPase [Candidatus Methanospirareceae archaeon]